MAMILQVGDKNFNHDCYGKCVSIPSEAEIRKQISLELSFLKALPSTYHHSHFWEANLDFTTLIFYPTIG